MRRYGADVMHASRKPSTSRLQIGESLSLRLRIEELSWPCHRIGESSLLRLRIEKPSSSRRRGAVAAAPPDQGATIATTPDRRIATITPLDREVAASWWDVKN